MPVILQDASNYVGVPTPSQTQADLVRELGADNLYLKPEAPPLGPTTSAIGAASGGVARIFDGSGGVALMDTHRRGIVGAMPGPDLVWAVPAPWDALDGGDDTRVHEISARSGDRVSLARPARPARPYSHYGSRRIVLRLRMGLSHALRRRRVLPSCAKKRAFRQDRFDVERRWTLPTPTRVNFDHYRGRCSCGEFIH